MVKFLLTLILSTTIVLSQEYVLKNYQIGDEWGPKPITNELLQNPIINRLAHATVKIKRSTGFYLGKFNGRHTIVTNAHVCSNVPSCSLNPIYFPQSNVYAKIHRFSGSWTEIDLGIFYIKFKNPEDEAKIEKYAKNFPISSTISVNQELITAGFGIVENNQQILKVNFDSDCKVFSNETRFIQDPDRINPLETNVWSIAHGCDLSHGDSGSVLLDRHTGEILGVNWSGKVPKAKNINSSRFLNTLIQNNSPLIWEQLSYAIPSHKIRSFLNNELQKNRIRFEPETLRAILQ